MSMKRGMIILVAMFMAGCGSQKGMRVGMTKAMTEAQYAQSVQDDLPFKVSEFRQVKPEVYTFRCDQYVRLQPDYEVDDEGALMIRRTTFSASDTHAMQPAQFIWRNIIIDRKKCRVLCVDRLLKEGKTFGYVYVLQGETKSIPNGYHWDVTDHRHMLSVAPILEDMSGLSIEALKALF